MPYADREKQLEWRRNYFKAKYAKEKEFRILEAIRKAEWLRKQGKPLNAAATKRAKARAKSKTTRKKKA
jgi:hypothetical protein